MSAAYAIARRLVGEVTEMAGPTHNHPFIQWGLSLCGMGMEPPDETPWCSAFVNAVCFLAGLPRSRSAAARSWLRVGIGVDLSEAREGDIIVLRRGDGPQPGPDVISAPGHVGFCAGWTRAGMSTISVLAGNQSGAVSIKLFPIEQVLGVRRVE